MKIHCKYDQLVDPSSLLPHPKNPNKHTSEQIKRLAGILEYQGWRHAIKISKISGCITTGHGRMQAAQFLGLKEVPVVYQDYDNLDQEYADIVADNSIASWAELDFASINLEIPDLGPDFDINMLGIKSFFLDASQRGTDPNEEWQGMPEFTQKDKTAFKSVIVHFHNQDAVDQFSKLLQRPITDTTRYLWFPEMIIEKTSDKRYASES